MKSKDEIKDLICKLESRRDQHYELANEADTTAGEEALLALGHTDQEWIEALEWVLDEN